MGRGRPRKPTALKLLQGNPGKRPISDREPKPPEGIPTCPPELDERARREWGRISRLLVTMGLLTRVDRAGLAAYCQIYSRWIQAEDKIREHGMVVVVGSDKKHLQRSPYLSIADKCLEQMKGYMSEFGLTPSSRTRIEVADATPNKVGRPSLTEYAKGKTG